MTDKDLEEAVSEIKGEISSLKRSRRFIDYYEAQSFYPCLDDIVNSIMELSKGHPKEAFILMKNFMESHESVMNRCDDSDGDISGSYIEACGKFGEIGKLANISVDEAVELVFEMFTKNQYGIYGSIICSFKDVLKEDGLELLKSKLLSQLSEDKIKSKAAKKKKYFDSRSMVNLETGEAISFSSEECRKKAKEDICTDIKIGLCEIADCRRNVDEYILACAFPKTSYNYGDFYDSDKKGIASRLLEQNRAVEALEWLSKIKENSWDFEPTKLKIAALESLNRAEEAQQERVSWFNSTLDYKVFKEIIARATPQFQEEFRKEAIKTVFNSSEVSTALDFFVQGKFIDECSALVRSKIDLLSGESYYSLRPAAKILGDKHPLSATLLYRKLIGYVMDGAKSRYYDYAVKDLMACEKLSKKICEYETFKSHEEYFSEFQERHKKKPAFWSKFRRE
ncbi:MAG: hypothetical protein LBT63_00980 [Holosporaceae bacterium]|jgi:hypothetical protein|nr:hypothetical protein [Holosporaceae bacterium]